MKTYNPEQDVSRLMLRDEREPKKSKLTSRIVKYVMEGVHEKRVDRVEEVSLYIERIASRDERTKTSGGEIIKAISLALMEHDGTDVFIDIVGNRLVSKENFSAVDLSKAKSLLTRAANRFASRFMRTVGESKELSLRFALALIEIGQNSIQEMVTARDENKPFELSSVRRTVTYFILNSFTSPPCEALRSRMWVEQLIEEANRHQTASDILHSIISLVVYPIRLRVDIHHADMELEDAMMVGDENVKAWTAIEGKPLLVCALRARHANLLSQWSVAFLHKNVAHKQKGNDLIAWFETNRNEIDRVTQERIQAITDHPRHGLRPFGFDRVNIKTSVLWNAGFRHIVFHPENQVFPNTEMEFGIVQVRPHITSYHGSFTDLQTLRVANAMCECEAHPANVVREILLVVLIDILYRIIAAPSGKRIFNDTENADEDKKTRPTLEVSVRPFIRRLPMGQEASKTARAFGEECFKMQLPTGVTFVRAHYRGGEISFDNLPTSPIMTYTDEHFRQLT